MQRPPLPLPQPGIMRDNALFAQDRSLQQLNGSVNTSTVRKGLHFGHLSPVPTGPQIFSPLGPTRSPSIGGRSARHFAKVSLSTVMQSSGADSENTAPPNSPVNQLAQGLDESSSRRARSMGDILGSPRAPRRLDELLVGSSSPNSHGPAPRPPLPPQVESLSPLQQPRHQGSGVHDSGASRISFQSPIWHKFEEHVLAPMIEAVSSDNRLPHPHEAVPTDRPPWMGSPAPGHEEFSYRDHDS